MEKLGLAFWFPKVGQDPFFLSGANTALPCFKQCMQFNPRQLGPSFVEWNISRAGGWVMYFWWTKSSTTGYLSMHVLCNTLCLYRPKWFAGFAQWTVADLGMNVPTSKTVVVFKFWVATCGHTKTRCIWQWRDPVRWGGDTGLGPWLEDGWLNWLLLFL